MPALESAIFPQPQEISSSGSDFALDNQVRVVVPADASEQDLLLAGMLVNELSDRFGLFLKIERVKNLSAGKRVILMGSIENPLVRQLLRGDETYWPAWKASARRAIFFSADNNMVLVAGKDDRGAFYGLQSLRQLVVKEEKEVTVPRSDDPRLARQAVSGNLYVPSRTRQY